MNSQICVLDGVRQGKGRFATRLYRRSELILEGKMVKLWVLADNSRIIRVAKLLPHRCNLHSTVDQEKMDLGLGYPNYRSCGVGRNT